LALTLALVECRARISCPRTHGPTNRFDYCQTSPQIYQPFQYFLFCFIFSHVFFSNKSVLFFNHGKQRELCCLRHVAGISCPYSGPPLSILLPHLICLRIIPQKDEEYIYFTYHAYVTFIVSRHTSRVTFHTSSRCYAKCRRNAVHQVGTHGVHWTQKNLNALPCSLAQRIAWRPNQSINLFLIYLTD